MPEITIIKGSRYTTRHEVMAYIALRWQPNVDLRGKLGPLKLVRGGSFGTGAYLLEMQLAKLTIGWDWDA